MMPIDEQLLARVADALADAPGLERKRMFGGVAFMVRGKMCVAVDPGRLMCRIDPASHAEAVARPGCTTVRMKGREYRGYVHVEADAVRTKAALRAWIDRALAFNARLTASE